MDIYFKTCSAVRQELIFDAVAKVINDIRDKGKW